MKKLSISARVYVACVLAVGFAACLHGLGALNSANPTRFFWYLVVAVLSSGLKVRLPGMTGTMSVNFLFILIGIEELNLGETVVIGCACGLTQSLWNTKRRPELIHVFFSVFSIATAVLLAGLFYHSRFAGGISNSPVLRLPMAAAVYFLSNTFPVACIIVLTEKKRLASVWKDCYFWSFPYYLAGATIACIMHWVNVSVGWQCSPMILPVFYLMHRSYRQYLERLDDEKKHAAEVSKLHLRTIEALALAIEAKDQATHDHLRRVQVYGVEIGREMGLSEPELNALRAAALLHDIGKLAVPEHIISKPGKLTPEEFEKMKIHPSVGAEILEQVEFPYPVVPVVRHHHEKWDGSGYPDGLKGEDIPVGARILAVVDCLDALASDRQYRRALPLDDALAIVVRESGRSFDPKVVDILKRSYRDLEVLSHATSRPARRLSSVKTDSRHAPANGFEHSAAPVEDGRDFLSRIADARQEAQTLFELAQELGSSLSLNETLSLLAARLKTIVPHDAIAIYESRGGRLIPAYVAGENAQLFASLEIPFGQGLSGWVAENVLPIVNGNPTVEPGYLGDPTKFSVLESALSVPLEGVQGVVGVLTLYRRQHDAFSRDNLRILLAISAKVGLSLENALKVRQLESTATTDYLTGLPNARSLFLTLDSQIAHCHRTGASLTVLVCDLDGFKQINDRFGHLEGNRVLQEFARRLRTELREYDCVARMGGDEFVLVLPDLEAHSRNAMLERLSRTAAESSLRVCGSDLLSVSIGGAHYPSEGKDAETLLARADRRMYQAKQTRRGGPAIFATTPEDLLEMAPVYSVQ